MSRFGRCRLLAACFLVTGAASADPPTLSDASPFGVRRGEPAEVTLTGANLGANPRLIASFPFEVEALPPEQSKPETWAFRLKVSETVAIGSYPIRVQTDDGISGPLLFSVGQLPQIVEAEANNTFETAQTLSAVPVVVEGRVAGNDVDFFRFTGTKGTRIVVDAQCARIGSGVDPSIRLSQATPTRRFLAGADDSPGLLTDARLSAELPDDGEYVVEISDSRYAGGGRPVYRLLIGEVPIVDEVYPLGGRKGETVGFELRGDAAEPQRMVAHLVPLVHESIVRPRFSGAGGGLDVESMTPIVLSNLPEVRESVDPEAPPLRVVAPVVINGRIDPKGDEDRFVVTTKPGAKLRVRLEAAAHGSLLDAVLVALNPKGEAIVQADDQSIPGAMRAGVAVNTIDPDPSLALDVPADVEEVTLVVRDLEKRGGVGFPYRIVVEPVEPTFEIALDSAQSNVPRGGSAVVGVTLKRLGYDGPVTLTVLDPPSGLSFRAGSVAAGQTIGQLSLAATADASFAVADLKIVGEGQGPAGPIRQLASRRDIHAQVEYLPTNTLDHEALPTAPASAGLVAIDVPSEPIEAVHGQSVNIPITLRRTPDADAAMEFNALPLPTGLTAAAVKAEEKVGEAVFVVAVAPEAPLGTTTVAVNGKGTFAAGEKTYESPVVTLNIVRPVELTLETTTIEIAPGATVEVKGKIVRRGEFKEPVVVKLDGLPAGTSAEPTTVAPEATDFVLSLVSEAGAAPAEAAATVAPAFQIAQKDYPTPPTGLAVKIVAPQPQ